jgi:hypothetical protein
MAAQLMAALAGYGVGGFRLAADEHRPAISSSTHLLRAMERVEAQLAAVAKESDALSKLLQAEMEQNKVQSRRRGASKKTTAARRTRKKS